MNEERMRTIRNLLSRSTLWRAFVFRRFLRRWHKKFLNNKTIPLRIISLELVEIGKGTYGKLCAYAINQKSRLIIGNYCSIVDNVTFLLSVDHPTSHLSTYPFKAMFWDEKEAITKGDIIVEDDVWIGFGAVILSGVKIGQGAIIAAGAIVTKDVPSYAVVAGTPAKVIRFRFEKDVIKQLLKINWSEIDLKFVENHLNELYSDVSSENIESLIFEFSHNRFIT